MNTERICPSCSRPLAAGAPQGLCPECLMKAGFGTGVAPEPGEPTHQPLFTPPTLPELAKLFPQLEIVELLGRGGMGAVYKARQPAIDRWVALKVLPPQATARPGFTERFNREARALARLNHPNIVALYEFGQVGGMPYFVMEYVEGVTLRGLVQAQRLEPREALKIVPQICEALQFAHDEGVVHRDIKPENILLDKKGRVKIADFGIAKILGGTPLTPSLSPSDGERVSGRTGEGPLTQDQILGTPNYMAPEQVEYPQTVDHRADIYSLGVVFYEMLTGELPLGKFQPPSSRMRGIQVDVRLDEVVLRALEKQPELRYQQASQVKTDIEQITAAAGGGTKSGPSSVSPAATGRRGACFFSTPERMRHCFPSAAAQIYICQGELRLAPEALTFLTPWQTRIAIPLTAIEELSVGQFQMWTTPWVMQYERVNYVAVTYSQDGRRQTVHLTPVPAGATSAQQINEQIGGWFEAIQQAVLAHQGAAVRVTKPGAVLISAEPAWNKKGVPLFVALLAMAGLMVWRFRAVSGPVPEPLGMALFGTLFLLLITLVWFSVGFLRANYALRRGDLEAVTSNESPEGLRFGLSGPEPKLPESFWVTVARWSARVLGTLLLAILALFVVGEGLPPMGLQPEGVQLSFAAVGLMALGLIIGWKREGAAALLIASGWTLWHIAEGRIRFNAFQTPLPVAALYGFCWWATRGRKTLVVLTTAVGLAAVLGVGLWLCPSSVFVRGTVRDALSGRPIPKAELTLPRRAQSPGGKGQGPNARADQQGRFALYVGWYGDRKPVTVAAAGYAPLMTNLGPRALGQRTVSRDFQLQPADGSRRTSEGMRRRFVRLVVDSAAMTFEGQPTTWDGVGALLEQVPDRTNTVLECVVTSDQITVQQQNEWSVKCMALAHALGFEYASFIGVHPLGSKGTPQPEGLRPD